RPPDPTPMCPRGLLAALRPVVPGAAGERIDGPESTSRTSCFRLRLREALDVSHIRWVGEHRREALLDHELVEHHVTNPHVGKRAPVAIGPIDIEFEPHVRAGRDEGAERVARDTPEVALIHLRRVHADEANAAPVSAADRVAVVNHLRRRYDAVRFGAGRYRPRPRGYRSRRWRTRGPEQRGNGKSESDDG